MDPWDGWSKVGIALFSALAGSVLTWWAKSGEAITSELNEQIKEGIKELEAIEKLAVSFWGQKDKSERKLENLIEMEARLHRLQKVVGGTVLQISASEHGKANLHLREFRKVCTLDGESLEDGSAAYPNGPLRLKLIFERGTEVSMLLRSMRKNTLPRRWARKLSSRARREFARFRGV